MDMAVLEEGLGVAAAIRFQNGHALAAHEAQFAVDNLGEDVEDCW